MGVYANWVYSRFQRKTALKTFARKAFQRVLRHLPRIDGQLWEQKASFMAPLVSGRFGTRDAKDLKRAPRVLHLIGSLQPGGAERQLCNCVRGQHNLGMAVSVLLLSRAEGEYSHYKELLSGAGVKVRVAGEMFDPAFGRVVREIDDIKKHLASIPPEFCPMAIDVFGELLMDPPDVFHSWLDHPNIWGGVGAMLARIPLVVLSTRNVNPTHFPYLASPYFEAMYQQLARSGAVRFINNSRAGADDYARWLGLPRDKFSVVLNGVDLSRISRAADDTIRAFREEIGVPRDARLVAGVFRLSEEKQPLTFLEVVRRLIERHDDVYVVVAGIGPYEESMREFIAKHGLAARVLMLGRRADVPTIFSAAELTLLCSRQEGTPNVLLEAQWLGCPVVATRAGGAVDAVKDGETGFLVNVGDIDRLVESASRVLETPALRNSLSACGREFIRNTFGVDRMVRETVEVYFS
jgi:glycosyltransferase involved in cell wall biosynthesis